MLLLGWVSRWMRKIILGARRRGLGEKNEADVRVLQYRLLGLIQWSYCMSLCSDEATLEMEGL